MPGARETIRSESHSWDSAPQYGNDIKTRLLRRLGFSMIQDREDRITEALTDTFKWIYHEQVPKAGRFTWNPFVPWLQSDTGLYWIAGKAGSGKSTLMKFLHSDPRTKEYLGVWAQDSRLVIASHFFWNSGNSIQMSVEGLIRTLLHAFRKILSPPFNRFRFFFFIDGLDECSGDHEELIALLKEMAASSHIKMCLASRPWSVFQDAFNSSPSLMLQHLTSHDIRVYINTKFYEHRGFLELEKGDSKLAAQLCGDITEKASGVFLWVRLVVRSLLRGIANGDRVIDLMRRLEDLPEDLEMLFRKILDSVDPAYKLHSAQLFQIHRTASEFDNGISLLHFSYADDDDRALWDDEERPLGRDEFIYRVKSMDRRLDSRTKGLLETTTSFIDEIEDK
ncbi:hypothetical protein AOQ84DRAFT_299951 [Glonium stellatum]|uniref:NACHT domain-containing protein n=1 Tax=Glonium stellatum TaxID=574774 RepID=A0A8E2EU68_9PEZI|nr:hypothetical protein AOQ84DRAFT_299951 [Glonium stellatum]